MLQIAQPTYYERRAIARDPDRASARAKSDFALSTKIDAAWQDNRNLYGARKIWHVLLQDNEEVARCTEERLMRQLGLKGVLRGKKVITTQPDTSQPRPDDIGVFRRKSAFGEPTVHGGPAKQAVGFRCYLCANLVWNGLRGIRDRCVCTSNCRLACFYFDEDPVRSKRAGASNLAKKNT